jgi:flap endonuclease-1
VLANVNWSFSTPAQEIFDFFKHPCRADYNISFPKIDEEKIRKLLCDKHEFSSERVENGIKRLRGEGKKKAKKHTDDKEQQSLGKWIKK